MGREVDLKGGLYAMGGGGHRAIEVLTNQTKLRTANIFIDVDYAASGAH